MMNIFYMKNAVISSMDSFILGSLRQKSEKYAISNFRKEKKKWEKWKKTLFILSFRFH